MAALLAVAFVDELASGVAPATAPEIARDLGLPPGYAAGAIIVAFHALAALVEGPLLAWSERVRVRWFSAASLAVLALSSLAAALAPGPWTLFVALAVYGPAAGCALAASEGALVEARPEERERTMARVGVAASLGDLTVPGLLALLAAAGLGWRVGMAVAAASAAVLAVLHASSRALDRRPVPSGDEDGPEPTLREALRVALGNRPLIVWSVACALTNLLDEVLVAFAAVHLEAIHAGPLVRSLALGGWTAGGLLGLFLLERTIDRLDPRTVLLRASAVSALGLITLGITRSPLVAALALTVVGASGAALHPLSKAQAYASLPGRPALVNAAYTPLVAFDMVGPLVLGVIAAHAGAGLAVGAIVVAPAGIALAAVWAGAGRRARDPAGAGEPEAGGEAPP